MYIKWSVTLVLIAKRIFDLSVIITTWCCCTGDDRPWHWRPYPWTKNVIIMSYQSLCIHITFLCNEQGELRQEVVPCFDHNLRINRPIRVGFIFLSASGIWHMIWDLASLSTRTCNWWNHWGFKLKTQYEQPFNRFLSNKGIRGKNKKEAMSGTHLRSGERYQAMIFKKRPVLRTEKLFSLLLIPLFICCGHNLTPNSLIFFKALTRIDYYS